MILPLKNEFIVEEKTLAKDTFNYLQSGVCSIKLIFDTAYAIQTTNGFLEKFGIQFMKGLSRLAVKKTEEFVISQTLARFFIGAVGVLASWPVMIAVNIILPLLVIIFTDNELQKWCEKSVFGCNSEVENTEGVSVEKRHSVEEAEQDKFIKTMHEMFGAPLSPKLQHEQDEREEKRRLKQEEYFKLRHAMKY